MATITNVKINILQNIPNPPEMVECTVTADLNFIFTEVRHVELGLREYILKCELWGYDNHVLDKTDNRLSATYPAKVYAVNANVNSPVSAVTHVEFKDIFESWRFNEDNKRPIYGQGGWTDEVYGRLILTNDSDNIKVEAKTPQVNGLF